MSSLQEADITFSELLQELPADLEDLAREFEAFTRQRVIKSPAQLLRLVFLYCGLDQSLRTVSATSAQLGIPLTDQAVRERLQACGPWLQALLGRMLPAPPTTEHIAQRLILVDGSVVQAPGAKSSDYRLHLGWEWLSQQFVFAEVTTTKVGESLARFAWQAGDVAVADRGYGTASGIVAVKKGGGEVIVRLQPTNFRLQTRAAEALDLSQVLRQSSEQIVTIPAQFDHQGESFKVWIHAYRLSEEAANRARQRCRRKASRSMKSPPKETTLFYCGWLIVLTTLRPEQLSAEVIGEIYRLRWQIELVIKRCKSLLRVDCLRAKRGGKLALVYLTGKMLYACLIERQANAIGGSQAQRWRVWGMLEEKMRPLITGVQFWGKNLTARAIALLRERPRQRKRQGLSPGGLRFFTGHPSIPNKSFALAA